MKKLKNSLVGILFILTLGFSSCGIEGNGVLSTSKTEVGSKGKFDQPDTDPDSPKVKSDSDRSKRGKKLDECEAQCHVESLKRDDGEQAAEDEVDGGGTSEGEASSASAAAAADHIDKCPFPNKSCVCDTAPSRQKKPISTLQSHFTQGSVGVSYPSALGGDDETDGASPS